VFEQIREQLPELQKLEETLSDLEAGLGRAQAKAAALANKVAQAREDDLNREALALNAGRKVPPRKEPELLAQLEAAQRELAVLERRRILADQERSRYIADNRDRLAELLAEAQAAEGAKVAAGASEVLQWLLCYYQVEDDLRALSRLAPAPSEENSGGPESVTTVWGNINTRNVTGGPRRGDLEQALRHLASLGPATEVGEVEDEAGAA
jgi:hypothetical protein